MKIEKTAVILSGGKSSRMNYNNKAFLSLNNESFIEILLKAVEDFEEIIISCNNFEKYESILWGLKSKSLDEIALTTVDNTIVSKLEKVRLVSDVVKDKGPIGGIYSALISCRFKYALFTAVDMPFLNKEILSEMGNRSFQGDALIPVVSGKVQPLCGVYGKGCIETIEKMLHEENYKLKNLLKSINTEYIEIHQEKSFSNINTIKEYENIINSK